MKHVIETDPDLLAKLTAAAGAKASPLTTGGSILSGLQGQVEGGLLAVFPNRNIPLRAAKAASPWNPQNFQMNDRARVAIEMAKTFMAIPGMLIHDEDERARIAVRNADALIKELRK